MVRTRCRHRERRATATGSLYSALSTVGLIDSGDRVRRPLIVASLLFVPAVAVAQPGGANQGTRIEAGQECPPGMTEIRPRNCQAPTLPTPSIVDYRPRSTLNAPATPVPKAKFPAIDFHGHPGGLLGSAAGIEQLGNAMDSLNLRLMIAAQNVSGDNLKTTMALIAASPRMKDRIRVYTGINFRDVGPGWAARAVAQLE